MVCGVELHLLDPVTDAVEARQFRQVRALLVARRRGSDHLDDPATEIRSAAM